MSLYHEAAAVLSSGPASAGGNLRARVFGNKTLTSSPTQVYALALETCKWSRVLRDVVENAHILQHEKKVRGCGTRVQGTPSGADRHHS